MSIIFALIALVGLILALVGNHLEPDRLILFGEFINNEYSSYDWLWLERIGAGLFLLFLVLALYFE